MASAEDVLDARRVRLTEKTGTGIREGRPGIGLDLRAKSARVASARFAMVSASSYAMPLES